MPDPVIRPASSRDVDRIAALISRLADEFLLHEFSADGQAHFLADHDAASIARRIEAGFRYDVAEAASELVGVVGVRDNSHRYHLFVAKPFQGCGLGRRLWEHAKAQCLAAGNPGVFTVNSSKNAVRVYEKFGFVATGPVQERGGVLFVPMALGSALPRPRTSDPCRQA